jgi:transcriptional regulator with XRE-family HTH domain
MTTKSKKSEAMKFLDAQVGHPQTFGSMLRALRLADEKTLQEYADLLGTSRQQLSDIERGERWVSEEKAADFARRLGHSERSFVRQVIEDRLVRQGLKFKVELGAA